LEAKVLEKTFCRKKNFFKARTEASTINILRLPW
jgi:hypothetical protein